MSINSENQDSLIMFGKQNTGRWPCLSRNILKSGTILSIVYKQKK